MMTPFRVALLAAVLLAGPAAAADLKAVDCSIRKEPVYRTKSPRYALLVFGPEAKDRVWLVHDGDTLYVDRNGNGDLTDPGEAVAVERLLDRDPAEFGDNFEVGELRVGGRVHNGLSVLSLPLARQTDEVRNRPNAKAALAADPKARVYWLSFNVDRPWFRGLLPNGQAEVLAGLVDDQGALLFADKPADAPVIHVDGPLRVMAESQPPALKLGRDTEPMLVVGVYTINGSNAKEVMAQLKPRMYVLPIHYGTPVFQDLPPPDEFLDGMPNVQRMLTTSELTIRTDFRPPAPVVVLLRWEKKK